jgi:hypothetical protein
MGRPGFLENKRQRLRRRKRENAADFQFLFRSKSEKIERDFQLLALLLKVGNIFPSFYILTRSWK